MRPGPSSTNTFRPDSSPRSYSLEGAQNVFRAGSPLLLCASFRRKYCRQRRVEHFSRLAAGAHPITRLGLTSAAARSSAKTTYRQGRLPDISVPAKPTHTGSRASPQPQRQGRTARGFHLRMTHINRHRPSQPLTIQGWQDVILHAPCRTMSETHLSLAVRIAFHLGPPAASSVLGRAAAFAIVRHTARSDGRMVQPLQQRQQHRRFGIVDLPCNQTAATRLRPVLVHHDRTPRADAPPHRPLWQRPWLPALRRSHRRARVSWRGPSARMNIACFEHPPRPRGRGCCGLAFRATKYDVMAYSG